MGRELLQTESILFVLFWHYLGIFIYHVTGREKLYTMETCVLYGAHKHLAEKLLAVSVRWKSAQWFFIICLSIFYNFIDLNYTRRFNIIHFDSTRYLWNIYAHIAAEAATKLCNFFVFVRALRFFIKRSCHLSFLPFVPLVVYRKCCSNGKNIMWVTKSPGVRKRERGEGEGAYLAEEEKRGDVGAVIKV